MGLITNGCIVSFKRNENVLLLYYILHYISYDGLTYLVEYTKKHELYTLKGQILQYVNCTPIELLNKREIRLKYHSVV